MPCLWQLVQCFTSSEEHEKIGCSVRRLPALPCSGLLGSTVDTHAVTCGGNRALVCGYVYVGKDCCLALRDLVLLCSLPHVNPSAPRSILAVLTSTVPGSFFPCTKVQGRGGSCLQGHGPHHQSHLSGHLDRHTGCHDHVRTTTTTTATATTPRGHVGSSPLHTGPGPNWPSHRGPRLETSVLFCRGKSSTQVVAHEGKNCKYSSFQHVTDCTLHGHITLTSFLLCLLSFSRLSTDRHSSVVQCTV